MPGDWEAPLAAGRLLVLSPFSPAQRRVTGDLVVLRNEFVAAPADEAWFAPITPGGNAERLAQRLAEWKISFSTLG